MHSFLKTATLDGADEFRELDAIMKAARVLERIGKRGDGTALDLAAELRAYVRRG